MTVITFEYNGVTFLVSRAVGESSDDIGPLFDGTCPCPGEVLVDAIGDYGFFTVSLAGAVADASMDRRLFAELSCAVTALAIADHMP